MKKPLIVFITVFFVSFLLINGMVYFIYTKYLSNQEEPQIETIESEKPPVDTLKVADEKIPDPVDAYEQVEDLKALISKTLQVEELADASQGKLDSLKQIIFEELDKTKNRDNKYVQNINNLRDSLKTNTNEIASLQKIIQNLEENISQIKQQQIQNIQSVEEQAKEKRLKYLADTYNSMKDDKVIQQLLSFDDDTIIKIFTLMNQRKVAKIMEKMPTSRSIQIANRMIN